MEVIELTTSDRSRWNDFVARNPHGDVLQCWEWGEVKGEGGDWTPICMAATDSAGAIRAGVLLLRRRVPLVGAFYYAPRGPLMDDWSDARTLKLLIDAVEKRAQADGAAFLKIDPAVPVDDERAEIALSALGFHNPPTVDPQGFGGTQPRCVMVLDVKGKDDAALLADFKAQCRRNIRKSDKFGVEVIEETTREHIDPFYELLSVTAKRDGFTVRPKRYYETIWDKLVEAGYAKLFLTRHEGVYLSGALCFVIGDKCWYVYGASSNESRDVMPNYGMQWAMIRWAREQGCRVYDFRGVSPRRRQEGEDAQALEQEDHLQGLNRFKEGFGARYVEYIGERDLAFNVVKYWTWNNAKPAAAAFLRRLRGKR
ncbi:MAG: peptidoglycan bridge formation glycyltransferase FemA/FemB family protein [Capsulimonadaceae bacterium]|nr:peptidoglycan bridge formation glycyltransferase FemA/FemB family protein [Capsulimonadaceae bacterium]